VATSVQSSERRAQLYYQKLIYTAKAEELRREVSASEKGADMKRNAFARKAENVPGG